MGRKAFEGDLLKAGGGASLGKVEKTVEVDAPMEKVFGLISHLERMPEYMPGIKKAEIVGEGPVANGTRARCVVEPSEGRELVYDTVIRDYEENRSIGWYTPEGPRMEGLWRLEPIGEDRTRVHFRMEWELPYSVLGKIIDKVKVEGIMARNAEQGLKNLQEMFKS